MVFYKTGIISKSTFYMQYDIVKMNKTAKFPIENKKVRQIQRQTFMFPALVNYSDSFISQGEISSFNIKAYFSFTTLLCIN